MSEISNTGEIIGYCRVSTDGRTLDAQIDQLKAAGATKLFAEKWRSLAESNRSLHRERVAS